MKTLGFGKKLVKRAIFLLICTFVVSNISANESMFARASSISTINAKIGTPRNAKDVTNSQNAEFERGHRERTVPAIGYPGVVTEVSKQPTFDWSSQESILKQWPYEVTNEVQAGYTVPDSNVSYVSSLFWGNCRDVKVQGNYAYCALANGIVVLDISDPSNPVVVSQLHILTFAGKIHLNGSYLYLAASGQGLHIIDVNDPGNPYLAATYDTPGSAVDVVVSGNFAYVADYDSGLQIINVSDPENPSFAGSYNVPEEIWYVRVFVSGNYAYIACYSTGLVVLDVSDPYHPDFASTFNPGGGVWSV